MRIASFAIVPDAKRLKHVISVIWILNRIVSISVKAKRSMLQNALIITGHQDLKQKKHLN
ncbi:hypothetical protein BHU72_14555 [Desulfuribacillus stibiiarsenatis]|uniref:Uncharacterized protein n=1 Tax=Desulfuribacillus stibiiarsenatis TaxID=1390249 RepID=A0A1E5L7T7_9FIRM|nr:hypothetical protein BHU72_14555 [Desulfuribacillus stibiiarsenatis]